VVLPATTATKVNTKAMSYFSATGMIDYVTEKEAFVNPVSLICNGNI